LLVQHLDGGFFGEEAMLREIHRSHTALINEIAEDVVAERGAGERAASGHRRSILSRGALAWFDGLEAEAVAELIQGLLHPRLGVVLQGAVGAVYDPLRAGEDDDGDAAVDAAAGAAAGDAEQRGAFDRRLAELAGVVVGGGRDRITLRVAEDGADDF